MCSSSEASKSMDAREKTNLEFLSVQNKFIARRNEQDNFRVSLRHVLKAQSNTFSFTQPIPRMFLLNGIGGLGKTTLLSRFIQICREEDYGGPKSQDSLRAKIR